MSQDPVVVELVRRVTNLEDDLMRQTARISVPVSGAFFSAYANATTPVGSGDTKVALGATWQNDGNFSTITSTYTVPVAGRYLFVGHIELVASGTIFAGCKLFRNSAVSATGTFAYMSTGQYHESLVAAVVSCQAGDTIYLDCTSNGTGTVSANFATTYLTGQIQ